MGFRADIRTPPSLPYPDAIRHVHVAKGRSSCLSVGAVWAGVGR